MASWLNWITAPPGEGADSDGEEVDSPVGTSSPWSSPSLLWSTPSGSTSGLFSSHPGGLQAQQDAEELLQALAAALEARADGGGVSGTVVPTAASLESFTGGAHSPASASSSPLSAAASPLLSPPTCSPSSSSSPLFLKPWAPLTVRSPATSSLASSLASTEHPPSLPRAPGSASSSPREASSPTSSEASSIAAAHNPLPAVASPSATSPFSPLPLRGFLATRVVCQGPCRSAHEPSQVEARARKGFVCPLPRHRRALVSTPFLDVSLSLDGGGGGGGGGAGGAGLEPVRLEALIARYTRAEALDGVECGACTAMAREAELTGRVAFLKDAVMRARERKQELDQAGVRRRGQGGTGGGGEEEGEEDEEMELAAELVRTERSLRKLTARTNADQKADARAAELSSQSRRRTRREGDDDESTDAEASGDEEEDGDEDEDELMERHPVEKRVLFSRLPECLVFHVGRQGFDPVTGQVVKIRRHVAFPLGGGSGSTSTAGVDPWDEPLDMAPFTAFGGGRWRGVAERDGKPGGSEASTLGGAPPGEGGSKAATGCGGGSGDDAPLLYDLSAVVVHLGGGSGNSGHYTCFRRAQQVEETFVDQADVTTARRSGERLHRPFRPAKARWVYMDDSSCREVDASQVAACEAYLLFYCRRKG